MTAIENSDGSHPQGFPHCFRKEMRLLTHFYKDFYRGAQ